MELPSSMLPARLGAVSRALAAASLPASDEYSRQFPVTSHITA
jgi:hypothetical protein